jgi:putative FmdB family regulatory protein
VVISVHPEVKSDVPLYEYQCPTCGRFEVIRKFSDEPLLACPTCGQAVQKLVSSPAFQFKGTGWYVTDYARKGGEEKKDSSGGTETKASDTKATDTKASDTKASDTKASDTKASETKADTSSKTDSTPISSTSK